MTVAVSDNSRANLLIDRVGIQNVTGLMDGLALTHRPPAAQDDGRANLGLGLSHVWSARLGRASDYGHIFHRTIRARTQNLMSTRVRNTSRPQGQEITIRPFARAEEMRVRIDLNELRGASLPLCRTRSHAGRVSNWRSSDRRWMAIDRWRRLGAIARVSAECTRTGQHPPASRIVDWPPSCAMVDLRTSRGRLSPAL